MLLRLSHLLYISKILSLRPIQHRPDFKIPVAGTKLKLNCERFAREIFGESWNIIVRNAVYVVLKSNKTFPRYHELRCRIPYSELVISIICAFIRSMCVSYAPDFAPRVQSSSSAGYGDVVSSLPTPRLKVHERESRSSFRPSCRSSSDKEATLGRIGNDRLRLCL